MSTSDVNIDTNIFTEPLGDELTQALPGDAPLDSDLSIRTLKGSETNNPSPVETRLPAAVLEASILLEDPIMLASSTAPELINEISILNPVAQNPGVIEQLTEQEEWTYMVYLDADNNLEEFGIEDFLEMASVGSNDNINIVVQMDRADGYSSAAGDWTEARRGLVEAGDSPDLNWGTSVGEVNMGDQSTLTDFVDWGMSNYQADNYAVVMWNHGGGWNSIANDATSGGDALTANEVSGALSGFSGIDLIGADACLMGMVEFAHQIKDSGSVFVGSEQLEPGDGWSYDTILGDLAADPTMTASELGSVIVNRYGESYGGGETQSATDLSAVDSLSGEISQLAETIMSDATSYDLSQLQTHRNNSAYFAYEDYRDLGTILSRVASDTTMTDSIQTAAETAFTAYESTIIQNHSGIDQGATGLSIYFPSMGTALASDYNDSNSTFAADTAWNEFLSTWATV